MQLVDTPKIDLPPQDDPYTKPKSWPLAPNLQFDQHFKQSEGANFFYLLFNKILKTSEASADKIDFHFKLKRIKNNYISIILSSFFNVFCVTFQ